MELKEQLARMAPELIALRRQFHQHPELGFGEYRTQEKIMAYLGNLGIRSYKIAKTGVAGVLKGAHPGRTLLLRSDMDALPVEEQTGLTFASDQHGIMHACGHDGHMAMLLTAARILCGLKDEITGNILLAFQPNEEDAGAHVMIEEGILNRPKVDAAFGCHLWSQLDTGRIDICEGPVMAASHYFTLTVKGRGGHAGFVHESVDPLFVASSIIQAVQVIQTREINALYPMVIMFTRIQGGSNPVTVPETVLLQGSIRFLYDGGEEILRKFEKMATDICHTHGATCTLEFKTGNHMLVNDPVMTRVVREASSQALGTSGQVTAGIRTMAGEDFSEFARQVPSAYAFIGSRNMKKHTHYPHHHPRFDIDEDALLVGTELYIRTALVFLKEDIQ